MQEEEIRPILTLFEIVRFHLMVLSHTERKAPASLRAFERAEHFADSTPVLLGTIPKLVGVNECLFDISELLNWVHNKEFVPVSNP